MNSSVEAIDSIGSETPTVNAMTVDVEDYFQVSAFESKYQRSEWDRCESRVVEYTNLLLDLFAEHDAKGTFFTLGIVAESYPQIVKRIVAEGHEIASHGYDHTRVTNMSEQAFKEDVERTKGILEDIAGVAVTGYRAPTFSISEDNGWAYPVLVETGHVYSSSIYPVKRDLYGHPNSHRYPFVDPASGIQEIPLTTTQYFGKTLPCAGGGFFRLYPYAVTRWCYRRVNGVDKVPAIFYTHPWEYDPEQPRPNNLQFKTRFRHYLNLSKTVPRLRKLLTDFRWGRMDDVFLGAGGSVHSLQAIRAS